MKIVYHGYYGARNSGDDAFVEVASWGAEKFWDGREHLFYASELPVLYRTGVRYLAPHKNYFTFTQALYELYKSDLFISAGGSTFHSSLSKTDLRLYAKMKKRFFPKGKAGAIGISLGPYRNSQAEKDTIAYLKQLDFLTLRDQYSYELANSYDLPYQPVNAFDLAALLPEIYPVKILPAPAERQKIVGISVCNYESYVGGDELQEEKRNLFVYELIKRLQANPAIKFRFFVFNGNPQVGDAKLTYQFINSFVAGKQIDYDIIPCQANVKSTFNYISECDLMIAIRLHAAIFACFAQVPFLLLEYHRKCSDFLDDVGQDKKYRVYDADRNVEEVLDEVHQILFNRSYISPSSLNEVKEKALRNFLNVQV